MAQKYAPALQFDSETALYPVAFDYDGNWWGPDNNEYWDGGLDRDTPPETGTFDGAVIREDEWYDGGDDGRSPSVGYGRTDQHRWLDEHGHTLKQLARVHGQEIWGKGDAPALTAYYKVIERADYVVYEYWFYYAYNYQFEVYPSTSQSIRVHEHDWESLFLWVSKTTGEPYHLRVSYDENLHHEYSIYDRAYQSDSDGIFVGVEGNGPEGHGMALILTGLARPSDGYRDGRMVLSGEWKLIDIDSSELYQHSGAAYDVDGVPLDGKTHKCQHDPDHAEQCLLDAFAAGYGSLSTSPTAAYDAGYTGFNIGVDGISTDPGLSYDTGDFINYYSFNQIDQFNSGTWEMRSEGPDSLKAGLHFEVISSTVVTPWARVEYWQPEEIEPTSTPPLIPDILWTRQFGTTDDDEAVDAAIDIAGNLYVVGSTSSALPGQTSLGSRDAFVRKYNSDGEELWTRQFGTQAWDEAWDVAVDDAGNLYVVGWTLGALPGQSHLGRGDAYLRKYDGDGNELWTRQFGSEDNDKARGVRLDSAGDLYVAGDTEGAPPHLTLLGRWDAFVIKYDSDGNELWTRLFGTKTVDEALGVAVDGAGNVYAVSGTMGALPGAQTQFGGRDAFVRGYDGDGNELWTRQFGTLGWVEAIEVAVDGEGNLYVVADTSGTLPGQTRACSHKVT